MLYLERHAEFLGTGAAGAGVFLASLASRRTPRKLQTQWAPASTAVI